jgi:hypothetical protein
MDKFIIIGLCLFFLQSPSTIQPIGGIELLPGYTYKNIPGVDTYGGEISKEGGMIIDIEYGLAGAWVKSSNLNTYAWYKEQIINGHKVAIALIKPGLKTVWEFDEPRNKEP